MKRAEIEDHDEDSDDSDESNGDLEQHDINRLTIQSLCEAYKPKGEITVHKINFKIDWKSFNQFHN